MLFEQMPVPGARWVEIVTITNKDGSRIGEEVFLAESPFAGSPAGSVSAALFSRLKLE